MSSRRRRWRREPVEMAGEIGRYRRISPAGGEVATLQQAWAELVGEAAALQSVVVRRSRAGVVAVACSSAAWAQELDGSRDRWVAELRRRVDPVQVTGIRFVVGDHVMPTPPPPEREPIVPTAEELASADAQTPQIADPVLRDLLVRAQAGQAALARERKRLQIAQIKRRGSRRG